MNPSPLDQIKVASPCHMDWRWMSGNDRVRYCRQCGLNVYNLSAMSKWEAEDLIRQTEGRLCVRFYRRADGTMLTEDCPVGLPAVKKKLARARTHILGALMSFLGLFSFFSSYTLVTWKDESLIDRASGNEKRISPAVMGARVMPVELAYVRRSEKFIREKAKYKVTPFYHATDSRRITGDAVVAITISRDGAVESAKCIKGNPIFKELAEEAARRWQFEPTIIYGEPIKVESKLTFHFGR